MARIPHWALSVFMIPIVVAVILFALSSPLAAQESPSAAQPPVEQPAGQPAAAALFRFPVVPLAEISSYFDHDPAAQSVRFYDGGTAASGFVFSCPEVGDSWVGCEDAANSEAACPDDREL